MNIRISGTNLRSVGSRTLLQVTLLLMCIAIAPAVLRAQTRAVWSATPVAQSNGTSVTMPLKRNVSRYSKLTLTIDNRWSQNYGYRPVSVTITSLTPAAADRVVAISLYSGWNGTVTVNQEVTLPKGSTSATATIAVPQYQMSTPVYWWDIKVDGFKDKDLSLKKTDAYNVMQSGYAANSGVAFLAVTSTGGQRSLVSPNSMEFEVLSLAPSEFPTRWIDYTCLDAVTLSITELELIKTSNPAGFQALRHWLASGGHLWVNDVGTEFEELPRLSKLLQLRESVSPSVKRSGGEVSDDDGEQRGKANDVVNPGWQPLRFRNGNPEGQVATFLDSNTGQTRTVRDPDVIARLQMDSNYSLVNQRYEEAETPTRSRRATDSSQWFIQQPMGLGMVRAFRETNDVSLFQQPRTTTAATGAAVAATAVDTSSEQMPRSLSAALRSVGKWGARHGLAPDDANLGFSDLLVPGMGLAPVTEFQILITLFVLVIGPLNYFLLKRWRRLHLMVLTVPLAAAVVTLSLFSYAIVADGFGTTVRAHSFTTVNQRTGESACWARLSYYSGVSPRGGLTMPVDVAMYPIIPDWSANSINAYVNSERHLTWEPEEAKLTRGWLRSRTPTQYLTVRARKSPIRLELTPVRDRMRVKNSLSTRVEYLVVADEANKLWTTDKLENGVTKFLEPVKREDAVSRFRKMVTRNAPQPPDALAGDSRYSASQRRQWQMFRGRYAQYGTEQTLQANLANEAIARLAGTDGKEGLELAPRSYVAVTATGPEIVYGMPGVEEQASFHVIVGEW